MFVLRPLLSAQGGESGATFAPGGAPLLPAADDPGEFAPLPSLGGDFGGDAGFAMPMAMDGIGGDLGGLPAPMGGDDGSDGDAVERLRGLISERQEETVEILRSWLEDGRQEKSS